MKKAQAAKFWRALETDTVKDNVISAFHFKLGYPGDRTLQRWTQAHDGFKEQMPLDRIAAKTGWSVEFLNRIHGWWQDVFPQTDASRPAEKQRKPLECGQDPVIVAARMKHHEELLAVAEAMTRFLTVPYFNEAAEWYERIGVRILGWRLPGLEASTLGEMPPAVIDGLTLSESQQATVPFLKEHLNDPQLCHNLEEINRKAQEYCCDLHSLMGQMTAHACQVTGLPLIDASCSGVSGLTHAFFDQALVFAENAPDPALDRIVFRAHQSDADPAGLCIGGVSPKIIAWAPADQHESIVSVFRAIVQEAAQPAQNLSQTYADVEGEMNIMRERLLPLNIRQTITNGKCRRCP